jgi:hypothetical protein
MMTKSLPYILALLLLAPPTLASNDDEYERAPIESSKATPTNDAVAQLIKRMERGEASLEWKDRFGYLPALLRELNVPASSQGLVFSRTSLQRDHISPRTPRAVYFNDDAYVGYVQNGGKIEIAASDATLGSVFYAIDQTTPPDGAGGKLKPAQIVRKTDDCLSCHGSGMRVEIPGLMIRSVFADSRGNPILAGGTKTTTQGSPLAHRWGGWYATGSTSGQATMANSFYKPNKGLEDPIPLEGAGEELTDLSDRIDTSAYLTPHSDPLALMVLEHQVEAHNRLTYAAQATLRALHDEKVINDALGETPAEGTHSDSTMSRVRNACEPVVEYLLFANETPLTGQITGTSDFAKEFPLRGPRDSKGRSLRDLDFKTRMMKYPLSYLVYSDAFNGLPELAKSHIYRRLWAVLSGTDTSKPFAQLTPEDRTAIVEILRETKSDLPAYWKRGK